MTTRNNKTVEEKIKETLIRRGVKYPFAQPKKNMASRRQAPVNDIARPVEFVPAPTAPLTDTTIYITGSVVGISGYDNLVFEIIKGLYSLGIDVRINSYSSLTNDTNVVPSYFHSLKQTKLQEHWDIVISPPCSLQHISKKTIVFTMWETDTLNVDWVKKLNEAAFVVVPSQWAIDSFRRCGVKVPIYKVPLGFDPLLYHPLPKTSNLFTFGTAAALTSGGLRKNTSRSIELFQKAFEGIEDVRLKIKITPSCPSPGNIRDKRIEVISQRLSPHDLAEWYRSLDVFLNLSYAEGFGLHLIEAMACGKPLISTHYSAVTEYFDESVGWITEHDIVTAKGGAYTGFWANPINESVIENMKKAYTDRKSVKEKGENALLRAKNFTWKTSGIKLVEILAKNGVIKI